MKVLNRSEAIADGFACFNSGDHYCIDLPNAPVTISVRTPDGKLVTFAFVRRPSDIGHQCVDIVHHGLVKNETGYPLQTAAFLGSGPTVAVTKPTDEVPTTIIALNLPAD